MVSNSQINIVHCEEQGNGAGVVLRSRYKASTSERNRRVRECVCGTCGHVVVVMVVATERIIVIMGGLCYHGRRCVSGFLLTPSTRDNWTTIGGVHVPRRATPSAGCNSTVPSSTFFVCGATV